MYLIILHVLVASQQHPSQQPNLFGAELVDVKMDGSGMHR